MNFTSHKGRFWFKGMAFGLWTDPRRSKELWTPFCSSSSGTLLLYARKIQSSFQRRLIITQTTFGIDQLVSTTLARYSNWKSVFSTRHIKHFRPVLWTNGLDMPSSTYHAVRNLRPPSTVTELKLILGWWNVFRTLVYSFARVLVLK